MKAWLKTWRVYIGQANSAQDHQERIAKLVTYAAEQEDSVIKSLGSDKFFCQAWIKYADDVADTEDVFDYMLDKQIGANFASTYIRVADYAENKVKDLRKAERTLRKGLTHLASAEHLGRELSKVERAY